MKFTNEYLNEMKREVFIYGVDTLLTPESFVQLIEELEKARKDTVRLDWLGSHCGAYDWKVTLSDRCTFLCRNTTSGHRTAREAVDAAMQESRE